jgi:glycosyltransferase involved in cell wall biosynthesis
MLVCVGIPVMDGKPCAQTVDSLLAEVVLGFKEGVHFLVLWEIGCSLIGVARNKIASRFLEIPGADCLIFVDADISWPAGALAKLAKSQHEVIGGTYMMKADGGKFHIRGTPEKEGDLYRVEGLPGGFIKMARSVFDKIDAKPYKDEFDKDMRDFFPTGFYEGRLWGEDYGFCRLWLESGGEIWLDPSIRLRHHDGARAFSGNFEEWLEGENSGN